MKSSKIKCSLCKKSITYFATFSDYDYYTPSSKIYYCKHCDLFQKKVDVISNEGIKIDYYQNYTDKELLNRSVSRKILDIPRSLNYLDIISKFINLKTISLSADIGGAEGLFSYILNNQYNNIKAINIEPDPKAVKIGNSLYPEISHHISTGEKFFKNYESEKKFDLITYFGGIYRSDNPLELVKQISSSMSDASLAIFTLPFSIDNPTSQAGKTYNSLGDVFGNDTMTFFDIRTLENLLKIFFEFIEVQIHRNKPFYKNIPFLIAGKPRKLVKKTIYNTNSNTKNLRFINSFYSKKSEQKLKTFLNKDSIINFYGSKEISFFFKQFCFTQNYKFNDFSIKKFTTKINEAKKINDILENCENNIFIFDQLSSISVQNFNQVCKRLNLYKRRQCFTLADGETLGSLLLNYSSVPILKKTIEIRKFTG